MAIDFSEIPDEKLDQLILLTAELQAMMRMCLAVGSVGGSLVLGLLLFLVVQSVGSVARGEQSFDRSSRAERQVGKP